MVSSSDHHKINSSADTGACFSRFQGTRKLGGFQRQGDDCVTMQSDQVRACL